ncbi:MAG: Rqc2 family fibronectin-binding protein [Calditrichia bacterium]
MHLHYLTLVRQTRILHESLVNCKVIDAYTQLKHECRFILQSASGEEFCLQCSSHPQYPYVLLLSGVKRKSNSTTVLPELIGKTIQTISILQNERLIDVDFFDEGIRLVLQLFTNRTNFLVVDEEEQIVNAFKSHRKLQGGTYNPEAGERLDPLALSLDEFSTALRSENGAFDLASLRNFHNLSRSIIREILYRSKIADSESDSHTEEDVATIYREMQQFLKDCKEGKVVIYFDELIPVRFALTRFYSEQKLTYEEFDDVNAALRLYNFRALKYSVLQQKTRRLEQLLGRKRKSLQSSLAQLVERPQDHQKASELKKIGELLAVQPGKIGHGMKKVTLVDYHDPELAEISISVNPNLSMHENAQAYFQRARKMEERAGQHKEQKSWLNKQLVMVVDFQERLQEISEFKALDKLEKDMAGKQLLKRSSEPKGERAISLPYKRYMMKDNEIWVGKNARQNDALTFKHASKHDFWLHVQGYSGSHVVIRNPSRHDHPDSVVLEYAAQLAVTNSRAKHASYVPVVYTQIRHVRKPRKSAPGSVIPEMVKTIFVDPL